MASSTSYFSYTDGTGVEVIVQRNKRNLEQERALDELDKQR